MNLMVDNHEADSFVEPFKVAKDVLLDRETSTDSGIPLAGERSRTKSISNLHVIEGTQTLVKRLSE